MAELGGYAFIYSFTTKARMLIISALVHGTIHISVL